MTVKTQYQAIARRVIDIELKEIKRMRDRIDAQFNHACELLLNCRGRIVVSGMGKSGHIARKIAATLSSTGSPAFFMHPAEASHGDLGMITSQDVVIALSNSGETSELVTILPLIKRQGIPLISFTGQPHSTLAQHADVNLDISVQQEACPLDLAPTASTTNALVLGDALAISLLQSRGFTAEDFAKSHPSGRLGRRLLLKVSDVMHSGNDLPVIHETAMLKDALIEMTAKKLGMTCIVDNQDKLAGIFTDGDLRRTLDSHIDLQQANIIDLMSPNGKVIDQHTLAVEALAVMEKHKITSLVVTNAKNEPIGVLHMHDLLSAKVI